MVNEYTFERHSITYEQEDQYIKYISDELRSGNHLIYKIDAKLIEDHYENHCNSYNIMVPLNEMDCMVVSFKDNAFISGIVSSHACMQSPDLYHKPYERKLKRTEYLSIEQDDLKDFLDYHYPLRSDNQREFLVELSGIFTVLGQDKKLSYMEISSFMSLMGMMDKLNQGITVISHPKDEKFNSVKTQFGFYA
ncbi:hypothetical protein ACMXYX_17980 (plasmid) [Neptuniibacter sp. QD72_48]|uniref:hypothetical protein n=1 Tax=Neptuniibacter sp. QD72_48 TaxID=3398214 RepID=UPI0039F4C274